MDDKKQNSRDEISDIVTYLEITQAQYEEYSCRLFVKRWRLWKSNFTPDNRRYAGESSFSVCIT